MFRSLLKPILVPINRSVTSIVTKEVALVTGGTSGIGQAQVHRSVNV